MTRPTAWLRSLLARLFKPSLVHFHTMRPGEKAVCGRGGIVEFTQDGVKNITCQKCRAWLEANPGYPIYRNTKHWLYGSLE